MIQLNSRKKYYQTFQTRTLLQNTHRNKKKTRQKVPAPQKIVILKLETKPMLLKGFLHYRNRHIQQEVVSHSELSSPCFDTGLSGLVISDVGKS